eukprot:ctg_791.g307
MARCVRQDGTGFSDLYRVHGSGQLGHGHRGRLAIRLPAAVGIGGLQRDGGAAADADVADGHRDAATLGAAVSGGVSVRAADGAVRLRAAGHRGHRSGGGARHRHRAQLAAGHTAVAGCAAHGVGHVGVVDGRAVRHAPAGAAHPDLVGRHWRQFCDRTGAQPPEYIRSGRRSGAAH